MKRSFMLGLLTIFLLSFASFAGAQGSPESLKAIQDKLVDASGNPVSGADLGAHTYLLIYFSAHWCPPCRAFTPKLVEFYNQNKKDKNFQIVFVSRDKTEAAMFEYMKETSMPWPTVKYDAVDGTNIRSYAGRGIPCLVLLDPQGKVLSHSYEGQQFVGPQKVLADLEALLQKK